MNFSIDKRYLYSFFLFFFVLHLLTVANVSSAAEILSAGDSHTCGVKTDGSVACWGSNTDWDYIYVGQATPPSGTFSQVSAGTWHTCGLKADGSVACWGYNYDGQATPPSGTFSQVSAGDSHTCGVKADGSVACWGYNNQTMPPSGTFSQVSVGWYHTCGVKAGGSVACWGADFYGQATPPNGTFSQVSAGIYHTCGVKAGGSVACWGNNEYGQASSPPSGTFSQVSAGGFHDCGLKSDGSVACWGNNEYGQATPPSGTFSQVSAGTWHTCGLKSDGSVACWGDNGSGQATPPNGLILKLTTSTPPTTSYTLSVQSSGNGTVTGSGNYQAGTTVNLTATPSSGYTFSGWSPSPCANTFTMPANDLTCTATFISSGGGGGGTTSNRIGGISTNALINTVAADYMVAGVFITGGTKRLVVRGVSVDGIINPRLTVQTYPDGTIICSNDDWQNHASASEVQQAGYAPTNSKDAAMVINLEPGLYTFTVSPEGVKGKAIVEVYELETGATNKIGGISTNAVVGTNAADYMIAGVFISGGSKKVMVRASSVDGILDPKLTVQSYPDGKILYTNSSWQSDSSAAQVQQLGYAPAKTTDAAMVITLPQGLFTFTVSPEGAGGKGIIEVYEVN